MDADVGHVHRGHLGPYRHARIQIVRPPVTKFGSGAISVRIARRRQAGVGKNRVVLSERLFAGAASPALPPNRQVPVRGLDRRSALRLASLAQSRQVLPCCRPYGRPWVCG